MKGQIFRDVGKFDLATKEISKVKNPNVILLNNCKIEIENYIRKCLSLDHNYEGFNRLGLVIDNKTKKERKLLEIIIKPRE